MIDCLQSGADGKQLRRALEKKIARALAEAGEEARIVARQRVPTRSGALKRSLAIKHTETSVALSTSIPYAPFVEYGTSERKGTPFLLPAGFAARAVFIEHMNKGGD